jgi:predicted metal-dependent hydrolase
LQVKHGQVLVRAPYGINKQFIDDVVNKKSAWLKRKIAEQQLKSASVGIDFTQNATLLIFGKKITLNITTAVLADVYLDMQTEESIKKNNYLSNVAVDNNILNVVIANSRFKKLTSHELLAAQVKKQLEQWLKEQAETYFDINLDKFVQQLSLYPNAIKIRQYRARWGSCNSKGELSFNYLLMMTPTWVIDYVIVHELCHLKYLNHSKVFWQLVEQNSPNYLLAKSWLKTHQSQLNWHL